jgi:hypothetical protein
MRDQHLPSSTEIKDALRVFRDKNKADAEISLIPWATINYLMEKGFLNSSNMKVTEKGLLFTALYDFE